MEMEHAHVYPNLAKFLVLELRCRLRTMNFILGFGGLVFVCATGLSREVALTLEGKDVKRRFPLISDRMIDCYPALLEDVIAKKRVHKKGKESKSADYSIIISSNCWN
ncbi:hypothetical protein CEXT_504881 [Caerostris extrusa]|uniref:Uncharacterized protein n=1 Tax=Caerostris extrusa TaxID=172846 RepID=A0AAV4UIN9_CAEEX|nr:hypothetical protein CEXT_504881 [Caerostris extrusa]